MTDLQTEKYSAESKQINEKITQLKKDTQRGKVQKEKLECTTERYEQNVVYYSTWKGNEKERQMKMNKKKTNMET